ncbi:NAD-dependent epimerase/dehydratase family protein [Kocuria marina]|uniref:NAD-dependent epimerase/dehydratase family protein n=1 Tax=Kocuria marina TaxID=223184 RepID=UPI0021A4207B|nr:NAD-dependent epimerase/dehydratase family protein [Kocuria marina]MCT1615524.1 NAD-dependent epimerase/dehydratase family protein [Kocuria marina]
MTRTLILGGTGWLGSSVARAARDSGDEVVCLARGESGPAPDGVKLVRADRLALGAYENVPGEWDEVIELAYEPELVRPALDALAQRAAHWTLISSVSVYAHNETPGADETAELVEPADPRQYPDAKVAAEQASLNRVGERLLIARPGLIVGPGDPSDRFGYWPARLARGGRVVVPDTTDRFVQVIDVDDLAQWVVAAGHEQHAHTVNAVGSVHALADFFQLACAVTGFEGELVAFQDDVLMSQNVNFWAGPRSLPLWLPVEARGFMQRDGSAFLELGGAVRSLKETLSRTLEDELNRGLDRERQSGLTASEEAKVLRATR